jgi:sn-glycerol 3-phosphate transport system ATP-binding protein
MVFQSYALFPHLSVAENVIFGLKVRKVGRAERDARLKRVADLVGLTRLPRPQAGTTLRRDGGTRGLARAIIAEQAVCLMDEPCPTWTRNFDMRCGSRFAPCSNGWA